MTSALTGLGLTTPVLAAPMAGGPSTPGLVIATASAGGLGLLAGGYKSADSLRDQITQVRAAGATFGVNLFAPNPVPVDPAAYREYAQSIRREADRFELTLAQDDPFEDDDAWHDKVELLTSDPVPLVTFTFGIPAADVIARLRRAGSVVAQTVTNEAEAKLAADAGVDALVVQAAAAGGHSGTLTPQQLPADVALVDLVSAVRTATELPLVATGGIATPEMVAAARRSGAELVAVGTALLLADEAGTSEPYRRALRDGASTTTVLTRAFSGRPARALRNEFTERYTATAPSGYPAVHHLTSPLRKAAAAAGDPERINLWAGVNHRLATAQPAATIIEGLARRS